MLWTLTVLACAQPPNDAEAARRLQALYDTWALTTPGIPTIDAPELHEQLNNGTAPVLVDTREPWERAVSTLPGAITLDRYEARREEFAGRPVVTYCTVGIRSGYVAKQLAEQGVNVRNLRGSILAWTHIGGELVTPTGEPTDDVHVYGKRWNFASSRYDAFVGDPARPLD